jgi:hypothetical protein
VDHDAAGHAALAGLPLPLVRRLAARPRRHVIPTVSWSTPDSYPFAFAGITPGSTVAVSTVGIVRDAEARALFIDGYAAMLDSIRPARVLVYGRPLATCSVGDVPVRVYPSRWADR